MVEEKVEVEVVAPDFEMHLPPDKREPGAEFQEEARDVLHQRVLDVALLGFVTDTQEVESIGVFQ